MTREGRRTRVGRTGLLGPHKQAKGWNVLALSNGRWKLPDDRFTAFLEHYVSDLPRYNLGLVVKKSAYFPYIMDVGQEQHEGRERGQPDGGAEGGRSGSEVGGRGTSECCSSIGTLQISTCCARTS